MTQGSSQSFYFQISVTGHNIAGLKENKMQNNINEDLRVKGSNLQLLKLEILKMLAMDKQGPS